MRMCFLLTGIHSLGIFSLSSLSLSLYLFKSVKKMPNWPIRANKCSLEFILNYPVKIFNNSNIRVYFLFAFLCFPFPHLFISAYDGMNKRPSKLVAGINSATSKLLPPPNEDAPLQHGTEAIQIHLAPDSIQAPRRTAGSEPQNAVGEDGNNANGIGQECQQHPQRRKRSNEPTKRRESKEKLRKSAARIGEREGQQGGDQQGGMEERLEELRRENNALKHKLEEQIRLNSVIVANPAKGANWRGTGTASLASNVPNGRELATTMGPSMFGSIASSNAETEPQPRILPPPPGPSSSSALFLSSLPSPNGILQKSEPSAFSVICRGQTEERGEQHLIGGPSIPPPVDLLNFYPPNFHFPSRLADNALAQSEFVRLAAQLTPFSLFSLPPASSHQPSSSNGSLECHQQQQQFINQLYGLADQGQQAAPMKRLHSADRMAELSRPLTLETSTNCGAHNSRAAEYAAAPHFPLNEVDIGGQEGPLDFSNKSVGVIRSKGNAAGERGANGRPKSVITAIGPVPINRQAELPRVQLDQFVESTPKRAANEPEECCPPSSMEGHPKVPPPQIASSSISPSSSLHFHQSAPNFYPLSASNLALAEHSRRQSVLEIASAANSLPPFPPAALFPNLNGCLPPSISSAHPSSLFNPFAHLFLKQPLQNAQQQLDCAENVQNAAASHQLDSTRPPKNECLHSPQRHHQQEQQRPNSPKKQKAGPSSSKNDVAGPSSSSMSMLGTLLAAPNKRHTSPTVPASRTELCSGLANNNASSEAGTSNSSSSNLAIESRRRIGLMERAEQEEEKKHQQNGPPNPEEQQQAEKHHGSSDSEHSSAGGSGGPSNSPTNSMDSLRSHSHHHHNSSGSSPSSTLPGAGSTVTTICGSDRTRRGSSSPSGNSGCSGDDSLGEPFHHLRKEMLMTSGESGEKGGTELGRNGENGRHSAGGHQKTRQSSGGGGGGVNLRLKLRTNEELERYMDRRRRNNEAAKRCRANRRAVFEYRSRRAQMLEAENGELRQEMIKLNNELDQLKAIIATNAAATRIVPNA